MATFDNQKYQDIVDECAEKGIKWTDPVFPPKAKSICVANLWDESKYGAMDWVRATKIPSLTDDEGDPLVFDNDPTPSDIK